MKAFSALRNLTTVIVAGRASDKGPKVEGTPYELKCGTSFSGHIIPFGQMVEYLKEPKRKEHEEHMKFDSKLREAVFLGYNFAPGCIWKKEYVVLGWKKAKRADDLRSTAVYRVREVQPLHHEDYPFITRVKELQCPHIFVHR